MSSMKGYLGAILPMALMMQDLGNIYETDKPTNKLKPEDINVIPKQTKPAKGCKEYWFNKEGDFYNGEGRPMLKSETVFYCHASNDKNAKRKFESWLKMQVAV